MKKFLIFLLLLITSITLYASDVILSNTLGVTGGVKIGSMKSC